MVVSLGSRARWPVGTNVARAPELELNLEVGGRISLSDGKAYYRCLPRRSPSSTCVIIARIASERLRSRCSPHASIRAISSFDRRKLTNGRLPVGGRPRPRFFCLTDIDGAMFCD